jgi:hypothetical protein
MAEAMHLAQSANSPRDIRLFRGNHQSAVCRAGLPNSLRQCHCWLAQQRMTWQAGMPAPRLAKKMDFRRSGQLDERRRRVLMDEIASPTEADGSEIANAASGGSAKGPVRAYSPAVLDERQPRVTDLLPVRPFLVAALLLLALTGVAAIEAIHIHVITLPLGDAAQQLAALDVHQRGSLAAWYSSALLTAASALSLMVFGIRAHRVDDYQGRYRIWLWTAAALAFLSLDAATGVHDALGLALNLVAGQQILSGSLATGSAIAWLVLYGLVLGALAVRLVIEIWPSLASVAALAVAGLLYLVNGLMQLDAISPASPLVASVVASTMAMLAHVALAATVGLYARHVYLDATGRLKVHIDADRKKHKSKSRAKLRIVKEDLSDEDKSVAAAPGRSSEPLKFGASNSGINGQARSGAAISKAALSLPEDEEDEDVEDEAYGGQRLSKSERRRLKKLARQQQRRAA